MKVSKLLFLVLLFTFFAGVLVNANEQAPLTSDKSISFNFFSDNGNSSNLPLNTEKFSSERNYAKLSADMKMLGLAGIIVTAVSGTIMIAGIIMAAVGFFQMYGGVLALSTNVANYATSYALWAAGCALAGIFGFFLTCGIAMIVVGYVLSWYFGKKAKTALIQQYSSDDDDYSFSTAISIKI